MTMQMELWQLFTLLGALFGAVWSFGRVLMRQIDLRLDARFGAQETAREQAQHHWDARFSGLERSSVMEANKWQRIERDLLSLKADLPVQYVRREDYVRNQTVIEAKLDSVALKIENLQIKGMQR